jgi:hypothetical protein
MNGIVNLPPFSPRPTHIPVAHVSLRRECDSRRRGRAVLPLLGERAGVRAGVCLPGFQMVI